MNRKRIGFLYLGETHSEYLSIARCLSALGIECQLIDLTDGQSIQWDDFSLINVRECRGYHRYPEFLSIIEGLEAKRREVCPSKCLLKVKRERLCHW